MEKVSDDLLISSRCLVILFLCVLYEQLKLHSLLCGFHFHKSNQILLKQGAQLSLISFPEKIKKIAVHHAFLTIDNKISSLLLYLQI